MKDKVLRINTIIPLIIRSVIKTIINIIVVVPTADGFVPDKSVPHVK